MKKYCINLDRREDRWEKAKEQFDYLGWDVERFSAFDEKPGWIGCAKSHVEILKRHVGDPKPFMIFEDDVKFITGEDVLEYIEEELPEGWDMVYLGVSPKQEQIRYSEHLFRTNNAHVTHAIMWKWREHGALECVVNHKDGIGKFDDFLVSDVQPVFNCFSVFPMMCTQWDEKSDICHRSDVSAIERNFKLYCR